jgi:hypothetical protein
MIYKIASRDNINRDRLELWPAVLDRSFTLYDNKIEDNIFRTHTDILLWLEKLVKDGNLEPLNKLYSVYKCNHDIIEHDNNENKEDVYLYSLRYKRRGEIENTFINNNNIRVKSSFKRINVQVQVNNYLEYSSEPININNELFEGIYTLDDNNNTDTNIQDNYNNYVNDIKDKIDTDIEKEYHISYLNSSTKWFSVFIEKLTLIEEFLQFYSNGGDKYTALLIDDEHNKMIKYILKILSDNQGSNSDLAIHTEVKNVIINPKLFDGEVYQIRYGNKLIRWNKDYNYIIRKHKFIPSKTFTDIIMNFTIADFYKQYQSKENLSIIMNNIENTYMINRNTKNKKSNFRKVIKRY